MRGFAVGTIEREFPDTAVSIVTRVGLSLIGCNWTGLGFKYCFRYLPFSFLLGLIMSFII